MHRLRVRTAESVRFSHNRRAAILFLRSHGRAMLSEIATALHIRRYRARALLFGNWPEYAEEYGLVCAGIVVPIRTSFGVEFQLTERGMAEADLMVVAARENRRI